MIYKMRIFFMALILSPILAHKHALEKWIGDNVNWDSGTEPFIAAEITQINRKLGPAFFVTKKSKVKRRAHKFVDRLLKKPNQPFKSKAKVSQRNEKGTIKNLLNRTADKLTDLTAYFLTRLFQN